MPNAFYAILQKRLIVMSQTAKKFCSVLLIAALLFSCATAAFAEDAQKNETPVIFIAGFVSTPTLDMETGDRVFPPEGSRVAEVFRQYAWSMVKSVIARDYVALDSPLINAAYQIFNPIRCDENGDPVNASTTTSFVWPTGEEILAKYDEHKGWTAGDNIYYSFDWRLDIATLSDQLHDFIEYVLGVTGEEKVDIIGSSMGACLLSAYLDRYDYEYIDKAIFLSGAFQGASVCGEPFTGRFSFDTETLLAFLSSVTGRDLKGELLDALIDGLYQAGVVDGVVKIANNINKYAMQRVYSEALSYIFGRIPGFWALIPYDLYDEAKENFVDGIVTDVFYEKIDYYHRIQGRVPEIIREGLGRGVQISIVSKYGTSGIPAVPSQKNLTDMIVDTKYSSIGATTALINEPFPEGTGQIVDDGHDRISPDRYIDASTCEFPDYTWFVKNLKHTMHPGSEYAFFDALFALDEQPTVDTLERYPQFLIFTMEDEIEPLTAENDYAIVTAPHRGETFFERFRLFMQDYFRIIRLLFELLKESIKF